MSRGGKPPSAEMLMFIVVVTILSVLGHIFF